MEVRVLTNTQLEANHAALHVLDFVLYHISLGINLASVCAHPLSDT